MFNWIRVLIFSSIKLTVSIFNSGIVQSWHWGILSYRADKFYKLGQYDQAVLFTKQALKLSQSFGKNHILVASSLNKLAELYYSQGRYSEAEPLYIQAIKIVKIVLPTNHPFLASSLNNLAGLYRSQGRYSEAEPLYQQAIEIHKIALPANHPYLAIHLNNLALLYESQGRYSESEPLYQQAIEIDKIALPANHPYLAIHLNNLALLYESQGRYSEAEPLYQQAIEIDKIALPANHPYLAIHLNNLANLYYSQGRYSKAEPLYRQAIEIHKIALPANHPSLATNLNNLALLYYSQGRYSKAERLLLQAIKIVKNALPPNHPSLATNLNNLAELYRSQGRYSEAEPLYQKVIEIDKISLNHPSFANHLNNLANLYYSQGRYSEAEPLFLQAIKIVKNALPANHPYLATSLNNLANLYRSQGRYSEAEPLFLQAIKIGEIGLPPNHSELAMYLNNLASLYNSQERYSEAEPLFLQAIKINKIALTRNHPSLATNLNNLAGLYHSQGRYSKAEPLFLQAIEINKIALPANHPFLASSLNNLAGLLAKINRPKEAFKLMLKASKIQNKTIQIIFASSSESDRLAHIQQEVRPNLEYFLSLVYQYFPHSQAAKQAALNLVLKRKALTATALAAQNQAAFSDRYPQLQEIFPQWRQKCDQLLAFTYQVPPPEKREAHKQQLAQLQIECNELERQLAREVPEIAMQEQMGDRRAVASELPEGAKLLEFVRFQVRDFQNDSWQEARYLAFVLAQGKPSEVDTIDLGEAENIDRLISTYRDSVIELPLPQKMMWNRNSTQTPAKHYVYDSQPGKQLREAVFDKLQDKLAGCSHLVIAPDGDLNLVPFQILPEDDETTTLQDEYNISYVSVGRELLRRRIKTNGKANESLIIADPNFDWSENDAGIAQPESNMAVSGLNVSQMFGTLASVKFERVKTTADFALTIGQQLGVKPFLQNEATGDRLLNCKSPKLLIVATHGYYSQRYEEYLRLLRELLFRSQEKQAEILAKNYGFVDEEFLEYIEALQNLEDCDNETREKLGAIYSLVKQQISTTSAKPPVNNIEFETFQPNRHQAKVENPMMRSAIAFTGANTWFSGGKLPQNFKTMVFAQDIAGIDLWETELTILIACQSGLGDVQTGEGVFGLRRAFAVAGSKTLIMSLWSVPTLATMLLMEQFLDYLKAGISRAEALKKAQQYIINVTVGELQKSKLGCDILDELKLGNNLKIDSQPLAHPYFWGAWVCQGE
ncbi:MAG: tetratricopeptide repeat protein [Okeania sp. SIO3B5]|uniref:tetratricopeptide repeat protein n=1 Tax=Okeania sp. SIO3B5 TaxID=2607811 RepID=UPI0013FFA147|nr:tetratricopeptide repeat protein [Okeania sp. SIO3B5]NEO53858.1 tetratricopeptide repeat protein [Okeania sp. SIO3B5]